MDAKCWINCLILGIPEENLLLKGKIHAELELNRHSTFQLLQLHYRIMGSIYPPSTPWEVFTPQLTPWEVFTPQRVSTSTPYPNQALQY